MQTAFVPREVTTDETRVAVTPSTIKRLVKAGLKIVVEKGAGEGAFIADAELIAAGAEIADDAAAALATADLVLMVGVPTVQRVRGMKQGASLVSFLWAVEHLDVVRAMVEGKLTAFSMDAIPRITRAQKDDALSSQANLAGYKAVLMAAARLPRVFPMLMTAAGTTRPAKVVVIGAGVAGLQAIATARRLGGVVEVSDVRPEVKEQVQSLGASYIEVESDENLSGAGGYAREQTEDFRRRQQEVLDAHLVAADVIICTALIPYRPAPKIVQESVLERMHDGSVIVDLAAERGGNCVCTVPGEIAVKHGVTVIGTLNVASTVAVNASEMYANNIRNVLLDNLGKDGVFAWNPEDEINQGALVVDRGEVKHPKVAEALAAEQSP